MYCPYRPLRPLVPLPHCFPPIPMPSPSAPGRLPPPPPAVSAFSSVANLYIASPLHSALLYALSSWTFPPTWYFPPDPLLLSLTDRSSVALFLPLSGAAAVAITAVFLLAAPALLFVSPLSSLFLPPTPLPPHPLFLELLHTPALPARPRAPPPPAPAANIIRWDENVGNQMSGRKARW